MSKYHFSDVKLVTNTEGIQSVKSGYQGCKSLRTAALETSMTYEWEAKDKTGQKREAMCHLITATQRKTKDHGYKHIPG